MKFWLWFGLVLFGMGVSSLSNIHSPIHALIGMLCLVAGPSLIALSLKTEEE